MLGVLTCFVLFFFHHVLFWWLARIASLLRSGFCPDFWDGSLRSMKHVKSSLQRKQCWNDSDIVGISVKVSMLTSFCTYPYSTVMVFVLPSGSRIVSSMSLGVVSEALSLTDPFTLPLVAPGGWVVWRVKVDVILLLLVTSFKLKTKMIKTINK